MTGTRPARYARWIPAGIVAFGAILFATDVSIALYFLGVDGLFSPKDLFGRGVSFSFCAAIAVGGYWLHRSDVGVARYPRLGSWVVGVTAGFLALNVTIMAVFPGESLFANLAWTMFAAYVGGLGGVLVGIVEARAIERAVRAERSALEAEFAAAQRQWLDYLNSLLRHEVLNNAAIIQGYANVLLEEVDLPPDADRSLETIHGQSRKMTEVVKDVRVLIQATDQDVEFEPVDLREVLASEVASLRATHPEVETDLSADGDATILADDLLPRIFSNLMTNAVEHNASESPRVEVTVRSDRTTVSVDVADDGPGIDDDDRDGLFERSDSDHGMGLYLVQVLANRYGGAIELADTGPDGSVFTVELPRAGTTHGASPEQPDPGAVALDQPGPPS